MLKIGMKFKNCICILVIIIVLLSIVCFFRGNNNNQKLLENKKEKIVNLQESFSNIKIGWGLKRGINNEQPDVGSKNKELLEKYEGICLGNEKEKKIYLTFDQGYEAGYTAGILEVLKTNNVTATFFLTAHYINTNKELVELMISDGHIIGNHTVNHKSMPDLTDEDIEKEIMKLHDVVLNEFGYQMKYIRPPMGEFSERTLSISKELGYITTMWSFAYEDWNEDKQPSLQYATDKILENLHNGEIVLLHGNSKTNMDILDHVIKDIKGKGYQFLSLDEFI